MRGRRLPFLVASTVLLTVAAACSSGGDETSATPAGSGSASGSASPAPLGGKLVVSNWDNYMPKDLVPNFEAATGVKVAVASQTTNEDIMGKLQASNGTGFDVVFMSGPFVEGAKEQGWLAEIDHSQIPNLANLYPEASQLAYDPGNTYSVPYAWGTTGLCYRTDLVNEKPTSWDVFKNPPADLAGKMTMLGTDRWLLQPALISAGDSINTTDESQINAATDWTIAAKNNLLGFDDTTFYAKLVSGEASLVQAWDGWCNYGIAEDPNITFVVPPEGSDVWTDTMVVMASSENKAAAFAFINWVLRPEVGAAVANLVLYKVPNQPAMESLKPKLLEQFPNMAITPQELLQQEPETFLGADGIRLWTQAVAKIKAS
jgi:spermidine/putrescine transport system substrate-binding protein